ncbi:MAG: thioredoxin family protein, partial [Myxococcales bacterium]|nr:thioredoxin family protein [Myxococcales bacterium]
ICNHCPFVVHLKPALAELGRRYIDRVGIVAISSNDVTSHPQDGPKHMAADHARQGYPFPYLYDETQAVAKAYGAACTPDFFLFDRTLHLSYRGQFDDSRPGNDVPVTGADLRAASDAVLAGRQPAPGQKPSLGCNIKWKPGNEPSYFG